MSETGPTTQTANSLVIEERSGGVVTLRLNRPEKLNALNPELCRTLVQALLRAGEDKTGARGRSDGRRARFLRGRGRWIYTRCAHAPRVTGVRIAADGWQGNLRGDRGDAEGGDRGGERSGGGGRHVSRPGLRLAGRFGESYFHAGVRAARIVSRFRRDIFSASAGRVVASFGAVLHDGAAFGGGGAPNRDRL